jgi:GntR family transcriptional regulator
MLDEKAPVSLYYQLKEILIKKIVENEWPVNTKLPAERELCDIYSVSRITVRQALDEMESEGYLYRKQGRGTFVTAPKLVQRLGNFYSFSEEIKKMGAEPSTKVVEFNIIECDEKIAQNLQIKKGDMVYAIGRLRLANKEPFAIETSYMPYSIVGAGLTKEEVENKGLYSTLQNSFNISPNEAVETFEAVLVTNDDVEYLKTKRNTAALRIERTTWANGSILEYCVSTVRGDRYKYRVFLK